MTITVRATVPVLVTVMTALAAHGQTMLDARATGIGAYFPLVHDVGEFPSNPAGLVLLRDWSLATSTYLTPTAKPVGFVFHSLAIGKRFRDDDAVGFCYTPGSTLRFIIPSTLILGNSSSAESNDREILYSGIFAVGYAHRFTKAFFAGLALGMRREEVTDTRYEVVFRDSISYPAAFQEKFAGSLWSADASVIWQPASKLTLSFAGRNLVWWRSGDAVEPLTQYRLPTGRSVEAGAAYEPLRGILTAGSVSSLGTGAAGIEWSSSIGLKMRCGALLDSRQKPFVDAITVGAGWSYQQFEVNAGYIRYTETSSRRGTSSVSSFDPSLLTNLDVQPYSRSRIVLTAKAAVGAVREPLAKIEGIRIFGSIYPASSELLAYKPIGTVSVRNISSRPINARVSFYVDRIMDSPTQSREAYIVPGGQTEIPLMAVFNEQLKKGTALTVRDGDVFVSATPAEEYDDRSQTRLVILGRNAWDGDVHSLRYFVTPDDPAVLRYSRDVLVAQRDSLMRVPGVLEEFAKVRTLINSFAGKLLYVSDPKLTADYVQYPSETLQLRGGDCDDITVCFTSLLSSIGVSTAFVDVVPPDHPEKSHIYMLCDTGVEPRFGSLIAENPKRYIVRRNAAGVETIWIPLETTAAARGFDEVWTNGAQNYFDDVEVGLGLLKGWVRIVDVN